MSRVRVQVLVLLVLLPSSGFHSLKTDILEMMLINKMAARHHNKAHPYMGRVYQSLNRTQDQSRGALVHSLRSVDGPGDGPRGWIWFSLRDPHPPVERAELVLFRKSLYLGPLSISVTLHCLSVTGGVVTEGPPLEERPLVLNLRPSSGFDVFDVSASVTGDWTEQVGFQLRYRDDRGSLVLHEELTQSLYSLDRRSVTEPLLVLYQNNWTTISTEL